MMINALSQPEPGLGTPLHSALLVNFSSGSFLRWPSASFISSLPDESRWRNVFAIGAVVIALHGAFITAYPNPHAAPAMPQPPHKVELEFLRPVVTPPMRMEPPKALPTPRPPPTSVKLNKPAPMRPPPQAPAPAPALRTAAAEPLTTPNALTIPENTRAPQSSAPLEALSPPPPAPKVEQVVIEAHANAAYLNNPPPEFPAFAQRQGWEGVVLLNVHVLASGRPDKVEIKQSSGRKTLDESALAAVRTWTFVPSRRGNAPIDGWATVPIEFKLSK